LLRVLSVGFVLSVNKEVFGGAELIFLIEAMFIVERPLVSVVEELLIFYSNI